MKQFKKWISSKGGIITILTTITLIIIALISIIIGYVYTDLGGNWNRLGEMFASDYAISIYIILGLVVLAVIYIAIMFKRNEEI